MCRHRRQYEGNSSKMNQLRSKSGVKLSFLTCNTMFNAKSFSFHCIIFCIFPFKKCLLPCVCVWVCVCVCVCDGRVGHASRLFRVQFTGGAPTESPAGKDAAPAIERAG